MARRAHCAHSKIGSSTYGLDDTSLQILTTETGQQKVGSVASSDSGSAGQNSDRLETHVGNLVDNRW